MTPLDLSEDEATYLVGLIERFSEPAFIGIAARIRGHHGLETLEAELEAWANVPKD